MHDQVSKLLALYHDGELDAERRRMVGQHLSRCADCSQALAALEEVSALLAIQPLPAPLQDADLWPELASKLAPNRPQRAGRQSLPAPSPLEWLMPAGLLLGQAAIQGVALMGLTLSLIVAAGLFDVSQWPVWPAVEASAAGLLAGFSRLPAASLAAYLPDLPPGVGTTLGWLLPAVLLVLFSIGLALLYLTWLTTWWQRRTPENVA